MTKNTFGVSNECIGQLISQTVRVLWYFTQLFCLLCMTRNIHIYRENVNRMQKVHKKEMHYFSPSHMTS